MSGIIFFGVRASSGGGGAVVGAVNGLSIDGGGNAVLGNDVGGALAALTSNREIPTGIFNISLVDVALNKNEIAGNSITIQDSAGNELINLLVDPGQVRVDLQSQVLDPQLRITNAFTTFTLGTGNSDQIELLQGGNRVLTLSNISGSYSLGDSNGVADKGALSIDGAGQQIFFNLVWGGGGIIGQPILIDGNVGFLNVKIGDTGLIGQGTFLEVNDTTTILSFQTGGQFALIVDPGGEKTEFGDLGGSGSSTKLTLEGAGVQQFNVTLPIAANVTAGKILSADGVSQVFAFGDIDAGAGGAAIVINDLAKSVDINNATQDLVILINGAIPVAGEVLSVNGVVGVQSVGATGFAINILGSQTGALYGSGADIFTRSAAGQVISQVGAVNVLTADGNGIATVNPGSGVGTWKLGVPVAGAAVVDATQFVEVMINGVIVKLAIIV